MQSDKMTQHTLFPKNAAPNRPQNADVIKAQIFACTNKTEKDCFELHLFGTDRVYGAATMRTMQGDFLFLLNLDSDVLRCANP